MSTISCTIGGSAVNILEQSFKIDNPLDARGVLSFTVVDSAGTANFTRGLPVIFSDSVAGTLYTGAVAHSQPKKQSPDPNNPTLLHTVTCMDNHYLADKVANYQNYTGWLAGNIVLDFLNRGLGAEGVIANYAYSRDTTQSDFMQGIFSNTVATGNVGDGDLELATAGSPVTITENSYATFSIGALTGVQVVGNVLSPTTLSAIKLQSTLTVQLTDDYVYVSLWSGSMTVGTLDTLHYDIWIASTSPQQLAAVDLTFSDGTQLKAAVGPVDQNGLPPSPTTDLSAYAKDQWYSRTISLGSGLNGKTINTVTIAFEGNSAGTYTAYFKNIYLGSQSGSPFFSTSAIVTQVNPPVVANSAGYSVLQTSAAVVKVFDPANNSRISPAYSIDSVKLLRSSLVSWIAPASFTLSASYDGITYVPCVQNSPLPALPAGSNVAGLSLYLKEVFGVSGSDPTFIPSLQSVLVTLQSAAAATKSDIVTTFASQSAWNGGTLIGTQALANGDLTIGSTTRDWNDNLITNQTSFFLAGVTQAATSGAYHMNLPVRGSVDSFGWSRLDFVGAVADFTLDIDLSGIGSGCWVGVVYRQTFWTNPLQIASYSYLIQITGAGIFFDVGSNSASGGAGSATTLASATLTGSSTHLRIVATGASHQFFVNNSSTPIISHIDATYTAPGNIALFGENDDPSNAHTATWDNLVVTPAPTGTWQGPSTSISSLGTCGPSAISWTEVNTANQAISSITMQTSVDGGSTYQTCTNGAPIPNLTPGSSVSGKSVIVKTTFNTISQQLAPILRGVVWRVLGAYPGSSGSHSTVPLGLDTMVRANQSGWGTAFDGQSWVKVGTGTDAIASNEATITNTTGDVHEILGSRTWTDQDATCRFQFSAATISAGIELRYTDTNNFYRFSASTTTLTLTRKLQGTATTIATASQTLSTGVFYRMRFRVVGSGPVNVLGRVWLDGTLEPTTWGVTATD